MHVTVLFMPLDHELDESPAINNLKEERKSFQMVHCRAFISFTVKKYEKNCDVQKNKNKNIRIAVLFENRRALQPETA